MQSVRLTLTVALQQQKAKKHRTCTVIRLYADPVWWDLLKLQESHNFLVGSPGIIWCGVWSCCVLRWMGAPPPPTLWWVEERKREKGETNLPTVSHHLLFGKASVGLLVCDLSAVPFPTCSEKKWHFCRCRSSIRCVLRVRFRLLSSGGSARETWDRRDAPASAYLDRNQFSEDWKWHTVGDPYGMRLSTLQHYHKILQQLPNL